MENNFIEDGYRILKCHEDSYGDAIWRIHSLKDNTSEFVVHVYHDGRMYITYFPQCKIPFKDRKNLLNKLCNFLLTEKGSLKIKIKESNKELRKLCLAAGFKYFDHESKWEKKRREASFILCFPKPN